MPEASSPITPEFAPMSPRNARRSPSALRKLLGLVPSGEQDRNRARFAPRFERVEGRALLATLHVGSSPGEFPTIGAAVTAANTGDTIEVGAGTYNESVNVS